MSAKICSPPPKKKKQNMKQNLLKNFINQKFLKIKFHTEFFNTDVAQKEFG